MPELYKEFIWETAGSYKVANLIDNDIGCDKRQYITDALPLDSRRLRNKQYCPLLDQTGLFRTFAFTETKPESIVKFANRFGPLGCCEENVYLDCCTAGVLTCGEPFEVWEREIDKMSWCVNLWDKTKTKDTDGIELLLGLSALRDISSYPACDPIPNQPFFTYSQRAFSTIEQQRVAACHIDNLFPKDSIRKALAWLEYEISKRMNTNIISTVFLSNSERTNVNLYMRPSNLLGAMWLQLAESISTGKNYQKCNTCDNWFEFGTETHRKTRLYCSDACRKLAYKRRSLHD